MGIAYINTVDDYNTIKKDNSEIVVLCCKNNCNPCLLATPKFEEFSEKYKEKKLLFCKVNIDDVIEMKEILGVTKFPSFVFVSDGNVMNTIMGLKFDEIEKTINYF